MAATDTTFLLLFDSMEGLATVFASPLHVVPIIGMLPPKRAMTVFVYVHTHRRLDIEEIRVYSYRRASFSNVVTHRGRKSLQK